MRPEIPVALLAGLMASAAQAFARSGSATLAAGVYPCVGYCYLTLETVVVSALFDDFVFEVVL